MAVEATPYWETGLVARPSPYGPGYRRARRLLLSSRPLCAHGCGRPATEADHQPPLANHDHREGSGCCVLVPSCGPCQRLQGAHLTNWLEAPDTALVPIETVPEPDGFDVTDTVWAVPWLIELVDVPDDATWPRLMTVPHPRAVGSLGSEFIAWVEERTLARLRWWQRLVVTRLLEVDDVGELVWEALLLSLSRQLGKSWLLRELFLWRIHQGRRFGGEQLVLHTGKDVTICKEIQRPARIWAKARKDDYVVREVNGQEEITYVGDGFRSRWMIRAREAVYGMTATMTGVDECWKVAPAAIEEGVVPTMVENPQTQLLLVSTAHRKATTLMLRRRAEALTGLATGNGDLLIEWSAHPDCQVEDRAAWRQASPHWTPRRERLIAQRVTAAVNGVGDEGDPDEMDPVEAVRAQWLNIWPTRITRPERGEAVVDPDTWTAAVCADDSVGPLVVGVAHHRGRGNAVAFAGQLPDGRLVVGGQLVGSRSEAWELADRAVTVRGGTIVTSPDLVDDPQTIGLDVRKASTVDTAAGIALIRELLERGELVHDGSVDLTRQVQAARVTEGARLGLLPAGRHDLLTAAVWAVRVAATAPVPEPAIY